MRNRRAFVIMPFETELHWVYEELIRPVCNEMGLEVVRADELVHSRSVMRDVVDGIIHSDVIVADVTGANPNVFYELGAAHALLRPVVTLSQEADLLPFDLLHHRVITYSVSAENRDMYRARLAEALRSALELEFERSNPVGEFMPLAFRERVVRANRSSKSVGELWLWRDGETGVLEGRGNVAQGLMIIPLYPVHTVHWGSAATGWGWDGKDAVTSGVTSGPGPHSFTLRGLTPSAMRDLRGTPYVRTVHDELIYFELDMWKVHPPEARQRTEAGGNYSSILEFPLRALPPYHGGVLGDDGSLGPNKVDVSVETTPSTNSLE